MYNLFTDIIEKTLGRESILGCGLFILMSPVLIILWLAMGAISWLVIVLVMIFNLVTGGGESPRKK